MIFKGKHILNEAYIRDGSTEMEEILKEKIVLMRYTELEEIYKGCKVYIRGDNRIETMNTYGVNWIRFCEVSDDEADSIVRICPKCNYDKWKLSVPWSVKGEVAEQMYEDGLLDYWPGAFDAFGFPPTRICMRCNLRISYKHDLAKWIENNYEPVNGKYELAGV